MTNIFIFCYGTLKKEFPNHRYCRTAVNIEPARSVDGFTNCRPAIRR